MKRVMFALALVCALAPTAIAKELCIRLNTGAAIRLKDVKLGKQKFGPVHGYYQDLDPSHGFVRVSPLQGQAITSSTGNLVVGLSFYETTINAGGNFNVLNDIFAINLGCTAGPDGKIGLLDSCDTFAFNGSSGTAQVIACKDVASVP